MILIFNTLFGNTNFANKNTNSPWTVIQQGGTLVQGGKKRRLVEKHLKILDSVVYKNPKDTVYDCCMQSIYFLVQATKIEVSTDGTTLGRISFSKSDWLSWHEWYKKKYRL